MVSILIPSRNEIFLQNTINNILENATGEIEIIVGLDGYWPEPAIKDNKKVTLVHSSISTGRRDNLNSLARIAKGKYIMKCDAHCAFGKGFDEILSKDCEDNWIVIPRRYSLNVDTWSPEDNGKIRDAHYISYPTAFDKPGEYLGFGMHTKDWKERAEQRKDVLIDDEMTSPGSCYFMHKSYWQPQSNIGFGPFILEFEEMGVRTWLTGGRVVVNKNTWYAHLWKGKRYGRMYKLSRAENKAGELFAADYWYTNKMPNRIHDFEWLIDKFWPVPTWPTDWKSLKLEIPKTVVLTVDENINEPKEPIIVETKKLNFVETVNYIKNKFNIGEVSKLPVEINYNRIEWGKLFNELGLTIGAEIGVYKGEYAKRLCESNPGVTHWCIDPYEVYADYIDYKDLAKIKEVERIAHETLAPYYCPFIKKTSIDAVKDFKDNSLDYVYIDGNHEFAFVAQDIFEWTKKVRHGGLICGHDFDKAKYSRHCHVKQCVTAYAEALGHNPWFVTSESCRIKNIDGSWIRSWMWIKN